MVPWAVVVVVGRGIGEAVVVCGLSRGRSGLGEDMSGTLGIWGGSGWVAGVAGMAGVSGADILVGEWKVSWCRGIGDVGSDGSWGVGKSGEVVRSGEERGSLGFGGG